MNFVDSIELFVYIPKYFVHHESERDTADPVTHTNYRHLVLEHSFVYAHVLLTPLHVLNNAHYTDV